MVFRRRALLCVAAFLAFLSGCASTNHLDEYRFRGRSLACRMRTPPKAEVYTDQHVSLNRSDPLGNVIRIGTSLAKAAEAYRAEERMERALEAVDIPEEIRRATEEEVGVVLGCEPTDRAARADFVLDLEIREYGIDVRGAGGPAEFRVVMNVVLREGFDSREVWRARIRQDEPIRPGLFGLSEAVDSIVTAVTLSGLSEKDIARGLMRLSESVANRVADRIARDLERARSF